MTVNKDKMAKVLTDSGVKLQYIARKTGLTRQTIGNMRAGREVRPTSVCKVCEVLGCRIEDII